MSELHPHWHATREEPSVQDIAPDAKPASSSPKRIRIVPALISRRPAAIAGIIGVLVIGFSAFGDWSDIPSLFPFGRSQTAQIQSQDVVTVTLTRSGADPAEIRVRPGQTIEWMNGEDNDPQIIQFDDTVEQEIPLLDTDGRPLYTRAIFGGDSVTFTVSETQQSGRYPYISSTSIAVKGVIIVTGEDGAAPASTSPLDSTPEFSEQPQHITESAPPTASTPAPQFPDQASLIPTNPYTVGSGVRGPAQPQGLHGGAPLTTPRPYRQPATGPALWIVSALSLLAFWWGMRRFIVR